MSYSEAIYSYVFKISRLLRDVKFMINLTHGDKLIGRFYYTLHGFSNKNLRLPLYQHYPNQFLTKERRKSLAKIVYLDLGTTSRHTFPSSELQCLPRGDPKNLCVNTRIRLLATHSLNGVLAIWAHKHAGKRMVSVNNCCLQVFKSRAVFESPFL